MGMQCDYSPHPSDKYEHQRNGFPTHSTSPLIHPPTNSGALLILSSGTRHLIVTFALLHISTDATEWRPYRSTRPPTLLLLLPRATGRLLTFATAASTFLAATAVGSTASEAAETTTSNIEQDAVCNNAKEHKRVAQTTCEENMESNNVH